MFNTEKKAKGCVCVYICLTDEPKSLVLAHLDDTPTMVIVGSGSGGSGSDGSGGRSCDSGKSTRTCTGTSSFSVCTVEKLDRCFDRAAASQCHLTVGARESKREHVLHCEAERDEPILPIEETIANK
jgi:hypothetical protein